MGNPIGSAYHEWEIGEGAVNPLICGNRKWWAVDTWHCMCGRCAVCGNVLHSAVHGHAKDGKPGDKPYGHRFVPKETVVAEVPLSELAKEQSRGR